MDTNETSFEQLGSLIDAVYNLRAQRLEMARAVDALKAEEEARKFQLLELLEKFGLVKASGSIATVGMIHKIEPLIEDWSKVYEYVKENDRFDLLQRRISAPAWRELVEGGELVPGTTRQDIYDVSLTKSTRG